MNLFRSEEHARSWSLYDPAFEENLKPLSERLERFSAPLFRNRGRPDYISWLASQEG